MQSCLMLPDQLADLYPKAMCIYRSSGAYTRQLMMPMPLLGVYGRRFQESFQQRGIHKTATVSA